jgi:hypothetical protein
MIEQSFTKSSFIISQNSTAEINVDKHPFLMKDTNQRSQYAGIVRSYSPYTAWLSKLIVYVTVRV